MKITLELLTKYHFCSGEIEYFKKNKLEDIQLTELIKIFNKDNKLPLSNWLISRLLDNDNKVRYAIYAAELVLHIFEDKYPDDNRLRKAIEIAKNYLQIKNNKVAKAAGAAIDAAIDATKADAWAAIDAAGTTIDAAGAAIDAAWANAAGAAAYAPAYAAGRSAVYAAAAAAAAAAADADADADTAGTAANAAAYAAAYAAANAAAYAAAIDAAAADTWDSKTETFEKIIKYGLTLINEQI